MVLLVLLLFTVRSGSVVPRSDAVCLARCRAPYASHIYNGAPCIAHGGSARGNARFFLCNAQRRAPPPPPLCWRALACYQQRRYGNARVFSAVPPARTATYGSRGLVRARGGARLARALPARAPAQRYLRLLPRTPCVRRRRYFYIITGRGYIVRAFQQLPTPLARRLIIATSPPHYHAPRATPYLLRICDKQLRDNTGAFMLRYARMRA